MAILKRNQHDKRIDYRLLLTVNTAIKSINAKQDCLWPCIEVGRSNALTKSG